MRETKFRGKRIDTGEWVYGDYYHMSRPIEPKEIYHGIIDKDGCNYRIDPETKGEWTGMVDETGQPVYEADTVKRHNGEVCEVIFDSNHGWWAYKKGNWASSIGDSIRWSSGIGNHLDGKILCSIYDPNHEELK